MSGGYTCKSWEVKCFLLFYADHFTCDFRYMAVLFNYDSKAFELLFTLFQFRLKPVEPHCNSRYPSLSCINAAAAANVVEFSWIKVQNRHACQGCRKINLFKVRVWVRYSPSDYYLNQYPSVHRKVWPCIPGTVLISSRIKSYAPLLQDFSVTLLPAR